MLSVAILNLRCDSIDPAVDVPSYISITGFDLATNYVAEGTDDHKITDAWVFVNDISLGAYELPAIIPVLEAGKQEIRLFPGIKENGIASSRTIYPFIDDTALTVTLIPGSTVNLAPQLSYYSDITFEWLEDFEIGSLLETGTSSDTSLALASVTSLPAMGNQSAVIYVDATNDYFFGATSAQQFVLPLGLPIYLELHYASTIEFSVGVIKNTILGSETLLPFLNVFPSGEWNKIYINLTDYLKSETDALSFEIYFSCVYDSSVTTDNTVFLDNIKLLYR